jgi:hypothetical protein
MAEKNPNEIDVHTRLEEKVNFLIGQVDRLNQTINPPVWKKVVRWIWRHWLTIAMLIVVGFIAWNAWEAFQALTEKVDAIAEIPSHAKESLWDAFEKVKFW